MLHHMKKHIPNTITCCNLISGCIATLYASQANYSMALTFIIIGAVFDFLMALRHVFYTFLRP